MNILYRVLPTDYATQNTVQFCRKSLVRAAYENDTFTARGEI